MSLLDLWTGEGQYLSQRQIAEILGQKTTGFQTKNLNRLLRGLVKAGLLRKIKIPRVITARSKRGKKFSYVRQIYVYTPARWVLKTLCDGFYEKRWKKLEKEMYTNGGT